MQFINMSAANWMVCLEYLATILFVLPKDFPLQIYWPLISLKKGLFADPNFYRTGMLLVGIPWGHHESRKKHLYYTFLTKKKIFDVTHGPNQPLPVISNKWIKGLYDSYDHPNCSPLRHELLKPFLGERWFTEAPWHELLQPLDVSVPPVVPTAPGPYWWK